MLMRPYASASLLLRSEQAEDGRPTLLVNLVGDEVDLTVVAERKIVFTRTARIPHSDDQDETDRRVLAEDLLDRLGFRQVPGLGRSAMGVDIRDLPRLEPGSFQGQCHAAG